MPEYAPLDIPEDGKLVHNIMWFARALRKAGLPVGPGRVVDAIRAVEAVGFSQKNDFYWTLHACFVSKSVKCSHRSFGCIGAIRDIWSI
jgi:uncharacterized protein with von Willebrand factor type A (vWA) domain